MGNTIIRTSGLTKRYGEVTAVSGLDLEIDQGEVFGLLGPNGAGKTTTTLMLLGLTDPTSGTASIDGHDCTRDPIGVKRIVGYLPDSVGFYPELTGRENLRFTGQLNGLDKAECEERAASLLERVGMTYAADRKAGTYSRGMKQRLGIADVLMKDPKVIIMDEPTLGIDPEGMRELIALIRELSVRDGRTILISSHQLYQVQQICDRVGIFVKGRLIALAAAHGELSHEKLAGFDERRENPWLYEAVYEDNHRVPKGQSFSEALYRLQSEVIRSIARREDAVIIGRCADQLLRDEADVGLLTVFVSAPLSYRVERKMEQEGLDRRKAEALVKKTDKQRGLYYQSHTGLAWGRRDGFDLYFDTERQSREEIVAAILAAYRSL